MRPVPRRLLPLLLTCLATGGCARMLPPSSYASLVEPPVTETLPEPAATVGMAPEDDDIGPGVDGGRAPGATDPVAALARSQARTARWMADPASRRSMAANLPAAFSPKRASPTQQQDERRGDDRTW